MKFVLFFAVALLAATPMVQATNPDSTPVAVADANPDSLRMAELDAFWAELSRTVREGDFDGYAALYHPDAVVAFGFGKKPTSMPVARALKSWKQGFVNTAAGKQQDQVMFRFTQRIGDASTAHETGMFIFSSTTAEGVEQSKYIAHFEMLLVKRDGAWKAVMKYQKSEGTEAEWDALR